MGDKALKKENRKLRAEVQKVDDCMLKSIKSLTS